MKIRTLPSLMFAFCLWGGPIAAEGFDCSAFLAAEATALSSLIVYEPLPELQVTHTYRNRGRLYEKVEIAKITAVDDPVIQEMIDFVYSNGGQIRFMRERLTSADSVHWQFEEPYFQVNTNPESPAFLIPIIAIDLTQPRALSSLAHELKHFKIFLKVRLDFIRTGMDLNEASKAALARVWDPDMIVYGERRAVGNELIFERKYPDHIFNRPYVNARPIYFWQKDYVNRITYPEYEAVRAALLIEDRPRILRYMNTLVLTAVAIRSRALGYLSDEDPLREYWSESSLYDLILLPFGSDRLEYDGTLAKFEEVLYKVCMEQLNDEVLCAQPEN